MRTLLARIALGLMAAILTAASAHACSCQWQPQSWYVHYFDYIVEGEVVSVTQRPDLYLDVVVQVSETWKGPCEAPSRLTLVTWSEGAACGYSFDVGKSYLIFVQPSERGLATGLCTNTQRSEWVPEETRTLLETLDHPTSPLEADPETAFVGSEGVFSGRVVTITPAGESVRVVLEVKDSWKGVTNERLTLYVDPFPEGQGFTRLEEYVVFADFVDGYWTAACARALPLDDAAAVLDWLGEPGVTPSRPFTWGRLKALYEEGP